MIEQFTGFQYKIGDLTPKNNYQNICRILREPQMALVNAICTSTT